VRSKIQADQILDVAARLFAARRFHEVRMEDIATEADIGKGSIYRFFKDKEELYLALVGRASEQFLQRVRCGVAGVADPRAKLEAITATIIDFFDEQPHLLELILRSELLRPSETAFPWQGAREEVMRLVLDVLEEGKDRGQFTVADPELVELMLLGGIRAVIRFGHHPRPANVARRIVDGLLDGFAATPVEKELRPLFRTVSVTHSCDIPGESE
jgi:TetR/AcrR family fatty acid metabolism transcriptional regulator